MWARLTRFLQGAAGLTSGISREKKKGPRLQVA